MRGKYQNKFIEGKLYKFKTVKRLALKIYKLLVSSNSQSGNNRISSLVTGDSYKIININGNIKKINPTGLNRDGHPTIERLNYKYMLSDTYPDPQGIQKAYIYDLEKNTSINFFELESDKKIMNTPLGVISPKMEFEIQFYFT